MAPSILSKPAPLPDARADTARTHASQPGTLVELSTHDIAPAERLDYWRHAHLERMALSRDPRDTQPFAGRIRRIMGHEAHLMAHASESITAVRSAAQCRHDGVDYVSINLMLDTDAAFMEHGGQHQIRSGSLFFVDSSRPVEFRHQRHHCISIFLPRQRVQGAIGADLSRLPVALPTHSGIGAVLQSHMHMIATQAAHMTPQQRCVVISACVDMALTALQTARAAKTEADAAAEQFTGGFYQAARLLIERNCGDPQLDPAGVASALGCSRATLYRLFARHNESVATLIWRSRLERARAMIGTPDCAKMALSHIAFACGFLDQASFSRMFRRHYGIAPSEARAATATRTEAATPAG